jgi:hypothetical protein
VACEYCGQADEVSCGCAAKVGVGEPRSEAVFAGTTAAAGHDDPPSGGDASGPASAPDAAGDEPPPPGPTSEPSESPGWHSDPASAAGAQSSAAAGSDAVPSAGTSLPPGGLSWPPPGPPPAPYASPLPAPEVPSRSHRARNAGIAAAAAVIVVVVVAVVVGRSSHSPTFTTGKAVPGTSSAGTPSGYQSFVDQTDHFSIAVPTQWRALDPSSPGAAAMFQQLEQDNPKLKAVLGSNLATQESRGMKFLSVDVNSQAAESPNVNVIVTPAPGLQDSDVTEAADQLVAVLAKAGGTELVSRIVAFDGHQVVQVSGNVTLNNPSGNNVTYPLTQYDLGANDFLYVITLSGSSPEFSTIATTFHTQ